jgi:hypothetical protein
MAISPSWQIKSPREMGRVDLERERDRLEAELRAGTLSTLAGSRLALVRRCLRRLAELRQGADDYSIG